VTAGAVAAIGVVIGVAAIDRQALRAEYRFQQVRKLARTVLFDLNPEIENLAGSTKARELLVRTSLNYLDSLASEEGNDPALRLELAEAYEKIGDIQGNPKARNLGQNEPALKSYGKAIDIARRLDRSQPALELMARAWSKTGTLQRFDLGRIADARESLRRAVEVAEAIPAKTGARAYGIRADVYGILGDLDISLYPDRAREPYRRSLEIAREWVAAEPAPESRDFLSRATARWGLLLWEGADLPAARDSFLAALRLIEKLREEQPGNAVWRMRRMRLNLQIGQITGVPQDLNLGDPNGAAIWLQEAVKEAESLVADPYDEWARYSLCEATAALAGVTGESDPARAEPLFRRSLALGDSLIQNSPEDIDFRDNQAQRRVGLAAVLQRLGRRTEALAELQRAAESLGDLRDRSPQYVWIGEEFGAALLKLASCRLGMGDNRGAEQDLGRALGVLEPLYRENPRNLKVLRDLADGHQGLGDLAASRSDWREACVQYQKSLDLWERWKDVGRSSVYDSRRRDIAAGLVVRAARKLS
jgi:eukaryotic-like serine/threonine-protein kinase